MNHKQRVVLVVDDTPENIHLLNGMLRDKYKVKAAPNGDKALKIAQTKPLPDIILLDVMMPDMDGYEVCRRLKADRITANICVKKINYYMKKSVQDLPHHRGRAAAPGRTAKPRTYIANQTNQLWSWDITYLARPVKGKFLLSAPVYGYLQP